MGRISEKIPFTQGSSLIVPENGPGSEPVSRSRPGPDKAAAPRRGAAATDGPGPDPDLGPGPGPDPGYWQTLKINFLSSVA